MQGLHLTADLYDCRCAPTWLTDAPRLGARCVQAVQAVGLQAVAQLFHAFPAHAFSAHAFPALDSAPQLGPQPGGVTATVLLAESHLCVHTWPERAGVTLDVYVCNVGGDHSAKAQALLDTLMALFAPTRAVQNRLQRGEGEGVAMGVFGRPEPVPAQAMILAAGRGERMRPLTDHTPKPLLSVRGKPLMQWPMEALARGGFSAVLVNTAWLEEKIPSYFNALGTSVFNSLLQQSEQYSDAGRHFQIHYSHETADFGMALETAGGISRALPRLASPFWVLAGDVYAPDFVYSQDEVARFQASGKLAHLWLVPNPAHNPSGDFGLREDGVVLNDAPQRYTFSTIALYQRALFEPPWCDIPPGNPQGVRAALAKLLRTAIAQERVSASLFTGVWTDVGTPQRLADLG
jgi:N-acetyl-alpha-D-muramate 1-phosphate uridylyltransferase